MDRGPGPLPGTAPTHRLTWPSRRRFMVRRTP
jgi:hypothetical protein